MKTRYIVLLLIIALVGLVALWLGLLENIQHESAIPVVHAQGNFCNQTIAISVAASNTQTILAAYGTDVIYVCGYVLSADTIATTATFKSGSTSLTGAMRFCDECNSVAGNFYDSLLFQTPGGGNLTVTAATGALTGFIRVGQH